MKQIKEKDIQQNIIDGTYISSDKKQNFKINKLRRLLTKFKLGDKSMWGKIEKDIDRAIGGIVYDIWGGVGVSTSYSKKKKEISLIIYNKSYLCIDKKEIINKKFHFNLENFIDEIRAKEMVITTIEKYLIENYT